MRFILLLWKDDVPQIKLFNDNNVYGTFSHEEAQKEAAYWRSLGFGVVLQLSEYQQ